MKRRRWKAGRQHSWRMVPWKRSTTALWLGERGGMRTWGSPLAARAALKADTLYSGPLSREHGADPHPVAPVVGEQALEEAQRDARRRGAHHEPDEGEAGEDVDGAELVHLAHALELADVEAVDADELARAAGGQAEPEGLVVAAASVSSPVVAAVMRRPGPGASLACPARGRPGAFARSTWRSQSPGHPADRRTGDSRCGLKHSQGQEALDHMGRVAEGIWGARRSLGIKARGRSGRPGSSTRSSGSARCRRPAGLGHVAAALACSNTARRRW